MNQDQRDRIQTSLVALWTFFNGDKGEKMEITRQRMYFEALKDLGFDNIQHACSEAIKKCKFFPRPVELRNLVNSEEFIASRAWAIVTRAIESHGAYKSVEFQDPAVTESIARCGGWVNFCQKPETWAKKDFIETYTILAGHRHFAHPRRLIGIHDKQNNRYRPIRIKCDWVNDTPALESSSSVKRIGELL